MPPEVPGRSLTYTQARVLLLAAGFVVLGGIALIMYAVRVDTTEVLAALLFLPIFGGILYFGTIGGVAAAAVASLIYGWLRLDAIDAVGFGELSDELLTRWIAYLAFAVIGGFANRQLAGSLEKLDLYDVVDDATGLKNARSLVQDTDLEIARARRYKTLFSVGVVDVPHDALAGFGRRARQRLLRDIGRLLQESVRTVDHAVHADDHSRHRFAVVLPETGPEGAHVFTDRLAEHLAAFVRDRGADAGPLARVALSYPDDEAEIERLREEFSAVDREEHPATS